MDQTSNLKNIPGVFHAFCSAKDSSEIQNPFLMSQVHSADVRVVSEFQNLPQVDALVTKQRGLMLTVKTADCAPVLFADSEKKIIACAHAGWRGAFQGILENTILEMLKEGAQLENIRVGIGPLLQKKSFQTSAEMRNLFPVTEHHFFTPADTRFLFDFEAYVHHRLKRAGIQSIESIGKDTYSDPNYWSYRRDNAEKRRQFSSIMLL